MQESILLRRFEGQRRGIGLKGVVSLGNEFTWSLYRVKELCHFYQSKKNYFPTRIVFRANALSVYLPRVCLIAGYSLAHFLQ